MQRAGWNEHQVAITDGIGERLNELAVERLRGRARAGHRGVPLLARLLPTGQSGECKAQPLELLLDRSKRPELVAGQAASRPASAR